MLASIKSMTHAAGEDDKGNTANGDQGNATIVF